MHRRSAADAAFGVFVRRQIRDVFLIWIWILCFAHFNWVPSWFSSQAAQRIWTAVRRLAIDYCAFLRVGGEVVPPLASLVGFRSRTSTCGLSFVSSLILPFLVVFLVLGCVSRAEELLSPDDLLVWD